jgi:hypothetical protein
MELINLIKSRMNNYRLTTDPDYNGKLIIPQSLFNKMFFLPSPYKDFGTFRVKPGSKGTQLLVHQVTYNFIATDLNSNKQISFSTVKDCVDTLKISRNRIVKCLINKSTFKGYSFAILPKGKPH